LSKDNLIVYLNPDNSQFKAQELGAIQITVSLKTMRSVQPIKQLVQSPRGIEQEIKKHNARNPMKQKEIEILRNNKERMCNKSEVNCVYIRGE